MRILVERIISLPPYLPCTAFPAHLAPPPPAPTFIVPHCSSGLRSYTSDAPWLTIGVLVRKEFAATSNGQSFSRWQLADLRGGELRAVLFGDAHAQHKGAVRGGQFGSTA
jgi:hypothetical protein